MDSFSVVCARACEITSVAERTLRWDGAPTPDASGRLFPPPCSLVAFLGSCVWSGSCHRVSDRFLLDRVAMAWFSSGGPVSLAVFATTPLRMCVRARAHATGAGDSAVLPLPAARTLGVSQARGAPSGAGLPGTCI